MGLTLAHDLHQHELLLLLLLLLLLPAADTNKVEAKTYSNNWPLIHAGTPAATVVFSGGGDRTMTCHFALRIGGCMGSGAGERSVPETVDLYFTFLTKIVFTVSRQISFAKMKTFTFIMQTSEKLS